MNPNSKSTRILGIAFLFQFVTSFAIIWIKPAWHIPGDIGATLLMIADYPMLLQTNILFDMLTALGVIFLGETLVWVQIIAAVMIILSGMVIHISDIACTWKELPFIYGNSFTVDVSIHPIEHQERTRRLPGSYMGRSEARAG